MLRLSHNLHVLPNLAETSHDRRAWSNGRDVVAANVGEFVPASDGNGMSCLIVSFDSWRLQFFSGRIFNVMHDYATTKCPCEPLPEPVPRAIRTVFEFSRTDVDVPPECRDVCTADSAEGCV